MNNKSCGLIVSVVFMVLLIALVAGQLITTQVIKIQKEACGLLEAGVEQLGNNGQPSETTPQTKEQCLKVTIAAEPLYRLYAVGWSIFATIFICLFTFALVIFIGSASTLFKSR